MDRNQGASGSLPIEENDDFDPYAETNPGQSVQRQQENITTISTDDASSSHPQINPEAEGNGLQARESDALVEAMLPNPPRQVDKHTSSVHGEPVDAMEVDFTNRRSAEEKVTEATGSLVQESRLPSPPPSSAPIPTLPGLDTLDTERSIEIGTSVRSEPNDSSLVATEVEDAESALGAKPEVTEEQAVLSGAEVESDSSPYESSSDDTSSDDSDDSAEDYELLDPVEQARRLMEGDGSDDEGGKTTTGTLLRTANETVEEIVEIPNIDGIAEMRIEELGNVEAKVENMILIKAKTSGEYQVLESGSVLCLPDRTVIGVVSETLGRVQEPLYCARFTDAATITGFGLERGSSIYFVPQHSTFVFTKALQTVKGSDASNIHDEEIGGDEVEFSDDEAEAEYKRKKKLEKQERKGLRGGSTRGRGDNFRNYNSNHLPSDPSTLSYDDTNIDDGLYTPLTRPSNLNASGQVPPLLNQSDGFTRGPGGMRGRGQRGHGRGGYRGRGNQANGRGFQSHPMAGSSYQGQQQHAMHQPYSPTTSQYSPSQQQSMYTPPQQFQQPQSFPVQGGQYPNQFQQYQTNQFANQQQSQQYPQQGYQQQWPAYNQAASIPATPAQASAYWNQAMNNFSTAYPNMGTFHPNQYQQNQQPPG